MSRRRVSVKDLGVVDCQGWLLRRKEGRSFLGSKWKRYWFVLKKCSLYWYTNKTAEKAEGFINLSGFTIQQAKQCRKKHAITASHPLVVNIFIAAEKKPPDEMKRLYNHLKAASLSPMGQSYQRDFRASFIRRCQNDRVNEKLHLLRILSSTLKAKESELLAVEQILSDPALTAPTYRKWRVSNVVLLQDISGRKSRQQEEVQKTGHSQCQGKIYCPNTQTISKEQWLNIMRQKTKPLNL
uniref:PH domain-containing protein n=1 Tax=Amphiprion ocellaris TaxID=80972 RepID=A0A3Q1CM01_AMPOC